MEEEERRRGGEDGAVRQNVLGMPGRGGGGRPKEGYEKERWMLTAIMVTAFH
ncbi:hypothetical protein IMZ48_15290 [Candidatus Bathyarchaeota archaeon]|nr:hypothetical protein [Candidatus Bathyarchaeota archaeon]